MGWSSTMGQCEAFGMRLFAKLGAFCAARPCMAIGLNFLVAMLCGLGFMAIEVETKGDRLWVNQESSLKQQMDYITDTYSVQPRVSFVTVTTNPVGGDALAAGPIGLLTTLHDQIMNLETVDGFRWSDVCVRDVYGHCQVTGTMGFFSTLGGGINSTIFTGDATTENIKNRVQKPDDRPWATPEHVPVQEDVYFMGWDEATTSAQGARSYYFLEGQFEGRCEREGLAECTTNNKEEVQKELEDLLIDLVEPYMMHNKVGDVQTPSSDGLIYLQAFRSLDDELLRAVSGDIVLFALTMNIMCTFCCIILGRTCGGRCMSSRFLLANGGIGIVMFAMIAGYGLSAGLGFAFTQLQQVLPFILIGIGVDDMVIIVSAFDRVTKEHPGMSIEERVGKAYARCGLSISLTSATDVMAFLLGSLSKLPAIHVFCVYACAAIFFTFCFMCTGFAGMLALDTRRQESHRYDCLPCIKSKASNVATAVVEQDSMLQRGFQVYASCLLKPPVKIAVLVMFTAVLSANTWGWTQTTSGFELVDLTPDESYVRDFVNLNAELLGSATGKVPFQVYTKNLDYHTQATQNSYQALHDAVSSDPKVEASSVDSWYLEFMQSSAVPDAASRDAANWYTASTFYLTLFEWLNARNSVGLRVNQRFENDIVWVDPSDLEQGIHAARFSGAHPLAVSSTSEQQVECLEAMEAIQAASSLEQKPFIWTFFYLFFDQFRTIYDEMMMNFMLCLGAIVVICLIFLHSVSVVFLTAMLIVMIDIDLVGSIHMWGLEVNSISVINMIMAIGLVVDYSAHVIHNFGLQHQASTRDEAVSAMLQEIGPPVFLGGLTTFLGIAPLAAANSNIFRTFFKMFLGIIVYGVGHGLVLMPVILSLFGSVSGKNSTTTEDLSMKTKVETQDQAVSSKSAKELGA